MTGEVRETAAADAAAAPRRSPRRSPTSSPTTPSQAEAAERTADLQRVTAEYANYRKRVDRDREAAIDTAKAAVVTEMLTVLDDIDRAARHGDLTGAFKAVADRLAGPDQAGADQFGAEGEFDPAQHEAVQFATSPEVTGQTVTAVMRHGYSSATAGPAGGGRRHRRGQRIW